ncbi:MAG: pilus assembly protein PilP [Gammaproteobacteria bacterium]|nr:pilus assembly protein PilP [Gammaproteobacteria bacterium]
MRSWRLFCGLCVALLLVACGREMEDLESYISEVKTRPARPLDPIPEIAPYVPVPYMSAELRDPFVPNEIFNPEEPEPEAVVAKSGPRPVTGREKEPLEAFPMDSLRMVGTLQIAGVPYALVRSGEPFVYRVRSGDYIGQNHGQVQRISASGMTIKELFADGTGRWVERETVMALSNAASAAIGGK